jgi:flagellar basal-body rod protein FlgB
VLSSNLTNADTPGYRSKDLTFRDSMTQANSLAQTNEGHNEGMDSGSYQVVQENEPVNPDENGVRLEKEMARLAGNTLRYNQAIELMRKKFGILRYAASNGGR